MTDIHEEVAHLRTALRVLSDQGVDRIIQLGDALDGYRTGPTVAETVTLLHSAGVTGVWGNHDFGFCRDVSDEVRARVDPVVLEYMFTVQPHLTIDDCHFSHVDPFRDANDLLSPWVLTDRPDTLEAAAPSFAAIPQRVAFLGHYHRWQVVSDRGPVAWDAASPLTLGFDRRFLVIVGPLVSGHFAVYDTGNGLLTPFRC